MVKVIPLFHNVTLTILTYGGSTQWHLPKGCGNVAGSRFHLPDCSCVLSGHLAAQNWVPLTRGQGLETQKAYLPSGRTHPWVSKSHSVSKNLTHSQSPVRPVHQPTSIHSYSFLYMRSICYRLWFHKYLFGICCMPGTGCLSLNW